MIALKVKVAKRMLKDAGCICLRSGKYAKKGHEMWERPDGKRFILAISKPTISSAVSQFLVYFIEGREFYGQTPISIRNRKEK